MSRRKPLFLISQSAADAGNRAERPAHETGNCGCDDARLPLVEDMDFGALDQVILDLVRCLCDGYASGSITAWEHACHVADERLGLVDGPAFVARVTALVRAMRSERTHGFGYMPLGCRRVSEDEQDLMAVVQAAVQGEFEDVRLAFERLVSVPRPERTLLAARALGALCARYQITQPAAPRRVSRTLN